ncbi:MULTISPECIES: peptide chain release factor-like protein [Myxococcus]|nr:MULTISPECIES: peptide chain release factor-like protein [Myxococcus]NOJ55252.1 peptide chain release factor-like protein [Myxococcus xanthus]NOJ78851.1 peptide chain release factor-like protein [Myxococcus xanthus]NOJ85712.1 peptide chain release factor-like protein [Myxococcus xanthus]NOK01179.1 peptide chain release factor-like protein [Myxococcus xanthus]QDE66735.1 peptide chain release factor I [Myxococcus xanthus]
MSISPTRRQAALDALKLDDESLLKACEVDYFIASGPGGQHRNTTASGVRLTHAPTELSVSATERRSQVQNKGVALERLREGLKVLTFVPKVRRATKPTAGSKRRRLEGKKRTSEKKALRNSKSGW